MLVDARISEEFTILSYLPVLRLIIDGGLCANVGLLVKCTTYIANWFLHIGEIYLMIR
jgi:hypothetical protein